jgi:hypothetical protein
VNGNGSAYDEVDVVFEQGVECILIAFPGLRRPVGFD